MIHLIQKWQMLSKRERWLLIEAFVFLFWTRIVFAFLPISIAFRVLGRGHATHRAVAGRAEEVGLAVSRAARYAPFRAVCLQRAFAAFFMLRRRGLPATVHFGVRHNKDLSLTAHAWSMSDDTPVIGTASAREFVPIAIFRA